MTQGFEFNWDGEIVKDSNEFTLLPNGEYNFTVENFERARSTGQGKWPATNMAKMTLKIDGGELGKTVLTENFILFSENEWKISSFFVSLGMKKKGEPFKMNWEGSIGKTGRVRLKVEEYIKQDGSVGETNRVDRFLEPDSVPQQNTQATNGGFNFGGGFK